MVRAVYIVWLDNDFRRYNDGEVGIYIYKNIDKDIDSVGYIAVNTAEYELSEINTKMKLYHKYEI